VPFSDLRRLGTIPATDFAGRVTERMTSSHPWRIRAVVSRLQLLMSHAITKPLVGSEERRPAAEVMVAQRDAGFVSRYHVCGSSEGGDIMAPAFPFPPPTPPRRLNWSSWVVIAVIVLLLVVIALIVMYSSDPLT
jgi:hypothetical protein